MKILAISDQIIDRLYSASVTSTYPDIKLLIGCGDLPYEYLEFLVSIYNLPFLYVPGNHDPEHTHHEGSYARGCENVDGRVYFTKGLLFAGMGGSVMYQPNTPNQYTQDQMYQRAYRLAPQILWQRFVHRRNLDVLITHSPPEGIHDDPEDPAHRGLKALNWLIRFARPRYMLHGHTVFYKQNIRNHYTEYYGCKVTNIYPFRVMELD